MDDAGGFYDGLADDYDCLFPAWWPAAQWHGEVVAGLLAEHGVRPPAAVLDAACGIGTQALPLAERGYAVTGTDLSPAAVQRARREAAARGLDLPLAVADLRALHEADLGRFDAVVACDNAVAHLLTDDDLQRALAGARASLRPGGVLLVSVRDYDALREARPTGVPMALHGPVGGRHASGQAWSWSPDGERVDVTVFTLREAASGWRARTHATTVRALGRRALEEALSVGGWRGVRWLTPEQSGYYQPVVVARAGG